MSSSSSPELPSQLQAAVRALSHEKIKLPSGLDVELSMSPPPFREADGNDLAVLLHPWSRLGGNMDDPVLRSFFGLLHSRHFHIITYNSRGTGRSSGWPSFSGLQEVKDLEEIVQWGLSYVPNVQHVLLIGYSYGSLITSLHPVLPPPVKTSHILLSYPLDKRSLLTFLNSKSYATGLTSLVQNSASNVLLIFGNHDQFTSIESYNAWAQELERDSARSRGHGKNIARTILIEDATHFWDGQKAQEMREAVGQWLDESS